MFFKAEGGGRGRGVHASETISICAKFPPNSDLLADAIVYYLRITPTIGEWKERLNVGLRGWNLSSDLREKYLTYFWLFLTSDRNQEKKKWRKWGLFRDRETEKREREGNAKHADRNKCWISSTYNRMSPINLLRGKRVCVWEGGADPGRFGRLSSPVLFSCENTNLSLRCWCVCSYSKISFSPGRRQTDYNVLFPTVKSTHASANTACKKKPATSIHRMNSSSSNLQPGSQNLGHKVYEPSRLLSKLIITEDETTAFTSAATLLFDSCSKGPHTHTPIGKPSDKGGGGGVMKTRGWEGGGWENNSVRKGRERKEKDQQRGNVSARLSGSSWLRPLLSHLPTVNWKQLCS